MKRLQSILLSLALVLGLGVVAAAPAGAINVFDSCRGANANTSVCNAKNNDNANQLVRNVISTLLFVVGIVSIIMIIVGGIRYTTSNGDSSKITAAKNTVLYSVVGLVVALLAYAIVNFVVARF